MRIFLDPGHGGSDPGAVSPYSGLTEASVNLDISNRINNILKKRGYETKMSRTTNSYVSLTTRATMANNFYANYFVSIHCNSSTNKTANGTETYYYLNSKNGQILASEVQRQVLLQTRLANRGVKQRDLAVLRLTKMPACLLETAFISNENESYLLGKPEFRQKIAQGVADAITQLSK